MEDPAFPDSHYTTTQTTAATTTTTTTVQSPPISVDLAYVKSVPGILRIVEIITNFIYWIMLAACVYENGFPLTVAISSWVITIVFFIVFLLRLNQRVTIINWLLTELLHDLVWTVLHFIAACIVANFTAKYSEILYFFSYHGCSTFAAVLGFVLMILYGVSTFFNFRIFQAGGGLSRLTGGGGAGGATTTTTSVTTSDYPVEKGGEAPPPY